jgi:hypothetical protein
MHTPTTGSAPIICNQYDASLTILHPRHPGLTFTTVPIFECNSLSPGSTYQAILGRDLLSQFLFVYDGPAGTFILAY